jgi:hypothetical protein
MSALLGFIGLFIVFSSKESFSAFHQFLGLALIGIAAFQALQPKPNNEDRSISPSKSRSASPSKSSSPQPTSLSRQAFEPSASVVSAQSVPVNTDARRTVDEALSTMERLRRNREERERQLSRLQTSSYAPNNSQLSSSSHAIMNTQATDMSVRQTFLPPPPDTPPGHSSSANAIEIPATPQGGDDDVLVAELKSRVESAKRNRQRIAAHAHD